MSCQPGRGINGFVFQTAKYINWNGRIGRKTERDFMVWLRCPRKGCHNEFNYGGKNKWKAGCPSCGTTVHIKKNKIAKPAVASKIKSG